MEITSAALFHIDGNDLRLTDEGNGDKKAVLDVVAVVLDEKGAVIDEFNRTYPIRIPKQGVATVQQYGLDFSTDIPFKKPGVYTFRLAVRDNNSKRLGSAGDFIEIPEVKKNKFVVSGLVAYGTDQAGNSLIPKHRPVDASFAPVFSESVPSLRRFSQNSTLSYNYAIYNAKLDASGKPNLTREIRLYRDGKLLASFPEVPLKLALAADSVRIEDRGNVTIGSSIEIGEYVLQLIVRDKVGNKVGSQWLDFEVVQ